ncbi:uncharacterized protein LOC21401952 [Morus notabilis]|uniref:uncharacterized protein LOC21401952 n=1 Tax=Morus notabilis TaxID=981085 RepID=UPI000CED0D30|nr:uncharacterized protein LOC21401952 [Morus notabilis]XP_024019634.1 uncharacterized protein LOC21401952 [Morus notabilis]
MALRSAAVAAAAPSGLLRRLFSTASTSPFIPPPTPVAAQAREQAEPSTDLFISGHANPLRTIWKDCFVDAFLLKNKNRRDLLMNRKIWSRRSTVLPEFVGCTFRIYNGKTFIKCKITEEKVGHKFGEFATTRKRRVRVQQKSNVPGKKKGKK